ncbi:hypothetical protein PCANB_001068 [Pneumocystis canis]|nr:hypothetical protein PCK1_001075 [Pneumocystis canis]KAG5437275.1 hypothetical protein PCANB_001068 [Pneumocystis canis]
MMQRKIGKLGQWTKEKLGREKRTQTTEEFKVLEQEMQMRYEGIEKLYFIICQWVKSMVNHKDDGKHTLMDAFSQTLLNFGKKFSSESIYGQGLLKYGIAHKEISEAQEKLITGMSDTVLNSMERSLVQFKDYQAARKKLENRRLSYESVSNRFPKAKKEDSRIEEELRAAKAKYEEACENIYNRIHAIQQAEATQLNDLRELLDMECKYYESCHAIMQDLKESWSEINDMGVQNVKYAKHRSVSAHVFNNNDENGMNKVIHPFQSTNSPSLNQKLSELDLNNSKYTSLSKISKIPSEQIQSTDYYEIGDTKSYETQDFHKTEHSSDKWNGKHSGDKASMVTPGKSVFPTGCNLILRNSNSGDFPNISQDFSGDDSEFCNGDKSDSYFENNSYESSSAFSRFDVLTSKSSLCLKTTPEHGDIEPPIVKTRKPPPPPRIPNVPDPIKFYTICKICDCDDYHENVFRKGQCNQCFHAH